MADWIQPAFALAVLTAMLAAFISNRFRLEAVALTAPVIFLVSGLIDVPEALDALSQPAPFTVACMFVLSAALSRTGCIDWLGGAILRVTAPSRFMAFLALAVVAMLTSSVVNNTAVVIVLIPIAFRIARAVNLVPSKLLLPLSYAAIFGGTCTLIGTSTNLVADGVAQELGIAPFGIFEITPLGLIFSAVGVVYLMFIYRWLPERPTVISMLENLPPRHFVTEMVIPAYSQLVGRTLKEANLTVLKGAEVIDILRFDSSKRDELDTLQLVAGDRLLIRGEVRGLLALREHAGFFAGEANLYETGTHTTDLVEGVVGPGSRFIGHGLAEFNLRRQFNVYAIAIHRQGENLDSRPESVRFEVGDCLLLEGPSDGIQRLIETGDLVSLTEPREPVFRGRRAPIALATIAAVMLLAAYEIIPIAGAAFLGALFVFATGCLTSRDVARAINWRVLAIIYSMLIVGTAIHVSGVDALIVAALINISGGLNPYIVLAAVYLVTILLTEVITNNAAAILLTPIAVAVAQSAGIDPRPFVVAVMFAASTSFASPIGYQTNTLVYTAGGYRYTDFLRLGAPLTILFWFVAIYFIPVFWPFHGP